MLRADTEPAALKTNAKTRQQLAVKVRGTLEIFWCRRPYESPGQNLLALLNFYFALMKFLSALYYGPGNNSRVNPAHLLRIRLESMALIGRLLGTPTASGPERIFSGHGSRGGSPRALVVFFQPPSSEARSLQPFLDIGTVAHQAP